MAVKRTVAQEGQSQIVRVNPERAAAFQELNRRFDRVHEESAARKARVIEYGKSNGTRVENFGPSKWLYDVPLSVLSPGEDPAKTREVIIRDNGVIVVAVDPSGKILFQQQARVPYGGTLLEVPGGGIKAGETPKDAATREFLEESGFKVQGAPIPLHFSASTAYMSDEIHFYFAAGLSDAGRQGQRLDSTENIGKEVIRLTPAEALEKIRNGEVAGPSAEGIHSFLINVQEGRIAISGLDEAARNARR